jgi:hypothetical protein
LTHDEARDAARELLVDMADLEDMSRDCVDVRDQVAYMLAQLDALDRLGWPDDDAPNNVHDIHRSREPIEDRPEPSIEDLLADLENLPAFDEEEGGA